MKLFQRFAFYSFGLLVGSIIVYFIWSKKNVQFDYLPSARVLKELRTDTQLFSKEATESMVTIGLDSMDIAQILEFGEVDFGDSKPRQKPCKQYAIDGNPKNLNIRLIVKKCDSIMTINQVLKN